MTYKSWRREEKGTTYGGGVLSRKWGRCPFRESVSRARRHEGLSRLSENSNALLLPREKDKRLAAVKREGVGFPRCPGGSVIDKNAPRPPDLRTANRI